MVQRTVAAAGPAATSSTTLTITFSEKVADFSNTDVTVANGSLGTLSSTDGIVWSGTFTPSVNLEDATNSITLASTYTDVAGNAGQSADSGNYTVDTKAPTASVTLTDGTSANAAITSLTAGQSAQVTITFSEAVKDFSNADVTAPNGTLSTLASTDSIAKKLDSGVADQLPDLIAKLEKTLVQYEALGRNANRLLETNPHPVIWIANDIDTIPVWLRRRMVFSLQVDHPPAEVQERILTRILHDRGLTLAKGEITELARMDGIAPGVARNAIYAAKLAEGGMAEVRAGLECGIRLDGFERL